MRDPVSGVFRVSSWYDPHPGRTPERLRLTGVVEAPGVPPTPAEHDADHRGKWVGNSALPITVDRADPTNFRVEWDQVSKTDWAALARDAAQQQAAQAARMMPLDPNLGDGEPVNPGFAAGTFPGAGSGASSGAFPGAADFSGPAGGSDFAGVTGPLADQLNQVFRQLGIDPNAANVTVTSNVTTSFGGAGAGAGTGFGAGVGAGVGAPTEPAQAVVLAVHDLPMPPGAPGGAEISLVNLTLDVTRADGGSYSTVLRIGFRTAARRAAVATVGARLPVLVDPANPQRVAIDTSRIDLP